jgi:osmotically-inducible protein OsmY
VEGCFDHCEKDSFDNQAKEENLMKTDKELQSDVLDELGWEPSIDAAEIGVSVENGVVILNGAVKTLNQKWTAERVAQRVDGVRAVTDELVVKLPGDSQYSDADIAQAAVNALDWNVSVPRDRIKVLVEHGWVTLKGIVEYHFEKEAAEAAVRHLRGVKGVSSTIAIKPRASTGDVIHAIKRALHRAAQVDAERISVEVKDGKVVLRGSVRTWAERDEAQRAAWAAPGISDVQNDIRIASVAAA